MLEKWNALSTMWKVIVGVIILAIAIFIFDRFTGIVSDVRSAIFDRNEQKTMQQVDELLKQNEQLRIEKKILEEKAIAKDAEMKILESKSGVIDNKIKKEQETLDKSLEELKREEEITEQPTDAFTRCERLRDKLIRANIKSATAINCNEYR